MKPVFQERIWGGNALTSLVMNYLVKTLADVGPSAKEEFISMIQTGKWNELIQRVPVKKGALFYVESGTIHALFRCVGVRNATKF